MAYEGLDVFVCLVQSFNLLLNLVYMTHKVVYIELASHGRVLSAGIGASLAALFILVTHPASYIVDFSADDLGDKGLHIRHEIGLDEVHLGGVDDDQLGAWGGVGVVVVYSSLVCLGGGWVIFSLIL